MKRYIQVFKNRTFPLMTVVVLLAVTLGYFLFYVRGREAYFTHRYVRLLAFESGRLEERLSTVESVFANYQKDKTLTAGQLKSLPGIERLDPPPKDFNLAGEGITQKGRIEGDRLWIYAGWKQGADTVVYRFDPFALARPDPPPDFELLFVARRDGTVLFQQGQKRGRELRIVNAKKLIGGDGKTKLDLSAFSQSTASLDVRFAGAPYKLFLRPCCRNLWEAEATEDSLEWIVGGAVRTSTLSTRAWSISFTVGMLLIAFFVLALLCLPFLRVLAIGAEEKLRMADALWVGSTAIVGVGLLTLLLLDLHAYRFLTDQIDDSLKALADKIDGNMAGELKDALAQLDAFNRAAQSQIGPKLAEATSCASIADSTPRHQKGLLESRESFIWQRQPPLRDRYSEFERFTWTDSQGQQCFKWALGEVTDPLVRDVKSRRYFQEAMAGRTALEPVFSMATGSRVVVLAQRIEETKRPFVGVLGIAMSSLNWPVMPQGYGFAVMNESGDVLFHSDPSRAGYENFFEEIDNDRELRALIYARRDGPLGTSYMGQGHRLWVKAIDPLGPAASLAGSPSWTLVVFSDKGEKRAFNVDVVTTAMLFLIVHLLVCMTGCWFLRAVNRRYRAGWLWPEKKGEERERAHLRLTVFYLLCIIASLLAIAWLDGVDLLWFAYAFPWAVLLVSYRLCVPSTRARWRFLLGAGLASVLLLIYLSPASGRPLVQALGLSSAQGLTDRGLLLALVSLGLWGFFSLPSMPMRFEPHPPQWIYEAAAALLLTLTAAVPAAAFFYVAHRAHLEAAIKRGQLELARSQEARDERVRRSYASFQNPAQGAEALMRGIVDQRIEEKWDRYTDFFFGTKFDSLDAEPATPKPVPAQLDKAALLPQTETTSLQAVAETWEPCKLPQIFEEILPLYNEDFVRVRRLISDQSGPLTWKWRHDPADGRLKLQLGPTAKVLISSVIPAVSLRGARVLWPASLLLLGGALIGVARFVARKFFLAGLATPEVSDPTSMALVSNQSFVLVSTRIDELAQILAARGTALIDLSTIASRADLLDYLECPDLMSSSRICLHHFEHRLQDEEHNLLKLELLEELTFGRDKAVIVLSHVVPAWYLLDRKPSTPALEKEHQEVQERWRRLLRRFLFWVCRNRADAGRLESSLSLIRNERALPEGSRTSRRLERLLALAREECGDSEQLQNLAGDLVRVHLHDLSRDLFIDDLRERAEPYYRALWAMCAESEKVILVQLAEGGLVNAKNAGALKMLMKRGLVKRDPSFRLMNESFRRFVAADVCLHEVRVLEHKAEASAWMRMRGPLTVVLLGVAAFFFVTQREVFDISVAFFSAVAASLPVVFRVLGTVAPGQVKSA